MGIVASAEKGETTTVLCAFNAGLCIPPAFIFKQKQPNETRKTQFEITEHFTPAYTRTASLDLDKDINGFRTCGIFPFNPKIFTYQDFAPAEVT